jgi:hypothetical protein
MRYALCIAALVLAGSLAACGSGGADTSTSGNAGPGATKPTKASFLKKGNRLCAKFNADVLAVLPQTPGDTSHTYEGFLFQLQFLAPHDKKTVAMIAEGLEIGDAYEEVEETIARDEGRAVVKRAKAEVGEAKAEFDKAARAYGLTKCANGPGFKPLPPREEYPYPGRFRLN